MRFSSWERLISLFLLELFGFGVDFATNVHAQQHSDSLLCRKCGHDITVAANLNNIGSKLAIRRRNDTILGVKHCLIQLFKNPHGQHFELITTTSANIKSHGEAFEEHSWFPGYAWRIAVCPQCGVHMGCFFIIKIALKWLKEELVSLYQQVHKYNFLKFIVPLLRSFEDYHIEDYEESKSKYLKSGDDLAHGKDRERTFVGLIYPNLIAEHYADSLIVTPKAYRS